MYKERPKKRCGKKKKETLIRMDKNIILVETIIGRYNYYHNFFSLFHHRKKKYGIKYETFFFRGRKGALCIELLGMERNFSEHFIQKFNLSILYFKNFVCGRLKS